MWACRKRAAEREAGVADWLETEEGTWLNLDRAHVFEVDRAGDGWRVYAFYGRTRYVISEHQSEKQARDELVSILRGDD